MAYTDSDFPTNVDTFRPKANLPGIVFDQDKPKVLFAEDLVKLEKALEAIQATLGLNLTTSFADVKSWLEYLQNEIALKPEAQNVVSNAGGAMTGDLDFQQMGSATGLVSVVAAAIMGDQGLALRLNSDLDAQGSSRITGLPQTNDPGDAVSVGEVQYMVTSAQMGGTFLPELCGLLCANYDPVAASSSTALAANGTMYVAKLYTPIAITPTKIRLYVAAAGATLTANQCGAAIYKNDKTLYAATGNQATAWETTGLKTMAVSGGSGAIEPGEFYVAVWATGTTRPSFSRAGATAAIHGVTDVNLARWVSANTGVTTTPPASLGAFTLYNNAFWVGIT